METILRQLFTPSDGKDQKARDDQISDEKVVNAARSGEKFLFQPDEGSVAKYIKTRWSRMDVQVRTAQNELRVNWRRYRGDPFAQIHPADPNRIFTPSNARSRMPPSVNKILRTVHRYQAQVTADEPIIEGVPSGHNDEARDQAEAATGVLRGEWYRMNLNRLLQRVVETSAVFRSGFWHFEFDPIAGERTPATKYVKNEKGEYELKYVNSAGEIVEDAKDAKMIHQGEIDPEVLFPFNVRWSGGRTLNKADEVFVGKVITLGKLYEDFPKTRDYKVKHFLGSVTPQQQEWMHEMRGAGGIAGRNKGYTDEELEQTGRNMTEVSSLLDEPVLFINYFRKQSRTYPDGFQAMIAGDFLIYRGKLRYGCIPVAQFKCLDDLQDPLGLGLVDLLKDPQELLDFVNGQVLRFLQSMKRRWFVPTTSNVNARDLLNPTRSLIYYNANSQAPTPEDVPNIPSTMTDWADRYAREFDDQAAIHETMQGKHVPGVSSGRHAEALRSGDETILGLTRTMIQEGLEDAGLIILKIAQKEWSQERKIRYFDGREYIEKAFTNADFASVNKVQLKRGTLLMLTQAQKLETLYSYAEMGVLNPQELRKLAPLVDTAGVSTSEDPHYIRARREAERFLAGPPSELVKARKTYERELELLEGDSQYIQDMAIITGADPQSEEMMAAQQRVQLQLQAVEMKWGEALGKYEFRMQVWESAPSISEIHFTEHASALATKKADSHPEWWIEQFAKHAMEHLQALAPPPEEGMVRQRHNQRLDQDVLVS
jgi:hypothetical protein